jgi:hypothetical protein
MLTPDYENVNKLLIILKKDTAIVQSYKALCEVIFDLVYFEKSEQLHTVGADCGFPTFDVNVSESRASSILRWSTKDGHKSTHPMK